MKGMRYCFEAGGHVEWAPLQQVITDYERKANGERGRPIVELVCGRHAATLTRKPGRLR